MLDMLMVYAPDALEQSLPILEKEGILSNSSKEDWEQYEVGRWIEVHMAVYYFRL